MKACDPRTLSLYLVVVVIEDEDLCVMLFGLSSVNSSHNKSSIVQYDLNRNWRPKLFWVANGLSKPDPLASRNPSAVGGGTHHMHVGVQFLSMLFVLCL